MNPLQTCAMMRTRRTEEVTLTTWAGTRWSRPLYRNRVASTNAAPRWAASLMREDGEAGQSLTHAHTRMGYQIWLLLCTSWVGQGCGDNMAFATALLRNGQWETIQHVYQDTNYSLCR